MSSNKVAMMVASVPSMIGQFNMANIGLLRELGYKIIVACNYNDRSVWTDERVESFVDELDEKGITVCQIDFPREPTKINMIRKSYKQLNQVVKNSKVDLIHCHTPVASMVARMVAHKNNIKVIYTAHGFHFYKGAPLKNWIIYYPIEKLCARITDVLITINKEDYDLAKKKMKAKRVEYVPGVGVNVDKISSTIVDKNKKREECGVPDDSKWIINVGELSCRKNQEVLIRAIAYFDDCFLTIVGQGKLHQYYNQLIAELGLQNRIKLLGFRTDVIELCKAGDIFAFPSLQEGLPVALMEAMACELPVVCSDIRGNVDLVDKNGGELFKSGSVEDCQDALSKIMRRDLSIIKDYNFTKIKNDFSIDMVNAHMYNIYKD